MENPQISLSCMGLPNADTIWRARETASLLGGGEGRIITDLADSLEKMGIRLRGLQIFRDAIKQSPSAVDEQ